MSWVSNVEHAVLNIFSGKADPSTPVIESPKTPIENALNVAAGNVEGGAAPVVSAIETGSSVAVQGFLDNTIGAGGAQLADAGLKALATKALAALSTVKGLGAVSEAEIAEGVTGLLKSLGVEPSTEATPAAAAAVEATGAEEPAQA